MNKSEFVNELSKQTGYSLEKCNEINSIIEDIFIIGKKNKEKMMERFKTELNFKDDEANKLYEIVMNILGTEIKNKLKHPFKSQDSCEKLQVN